MRLLLNVNTGWFLISHRMEIARAARDAGYEVHVCAGIESADEEEKIRSEGFYLHRVNIDRSGLSPFRDLQYLWQVRSVMKRICPDLVHNVTVKPIVYGTIAARAFSVPGVVNAVSGLGYAFGGGGSRKAVSFLVRSAYRVSLKGKGSGKIIFQNRDDLDAFVGAKIIERSQAVLIRGSGVDLDAFGYVEESPGIPLVVFPGRMLRDKGVLEFVEAGQLLRQRGCRVKFALAGKIDRGNPSSLGEEDMALIREESGVDWLGHVSDMASLLRRAHVVCLPSYYSEGLPKALLEACAAGRAIVTTDMPGCREAVRHGENGFLIEARSPRAIADAVEVLIRDVDLRRKMGAAGRRIAESEFDVRSVVRATLDVYRSALCDCTM